ncbi:MAG: djlA [Rhodospirillales bacterium]|nr:djlA [Rhodospirillales bacterium]
MNAWSKSAPPRPGFRPRYRSQPEIRHEGLAAATLRLIAGWAKRLANRYLGHIAERASRNAHRQSYSVATIVLAAKLAKVDGPVTRKEIDAFKSLFKIAEDEVTDVARIWTAAKRDARGFEAYAHRLGILFAGDRNLQENMMTALIHLALADGAMNELEIRFLERVAMAFGLDRPSLARLRAKIETPAEDDPYTVLGVSPHASEQDVKRAWRRLVRVYHPDAVMASGRSGDLAHAQQKVAAINNAYETIERERERAA